jgi:hypothetical protein
MNRHFNICFDFSRRRVIVADINNNLLLGGGAVKWNTRSRQERLKTVLETWQGSYIVSPSV